MFSSEGILYKHPVREESSKKSPKIFVLIMILMLLVRRYHTGLVREKRILLINS